MSRRSAKVERLVIVGFVLVGTVVGGLSLARILDHLRGAEVVELRDLQADPFDRSAGPVAIEGIDAIDAAQIAADVAWLAAPERGGRDTPSVGLRAAQDFVAERFESAGLESVTELPFRHEYEADSVWFGRVPMTRPSAEGCRLRVPGVAGSVLGRDFVPLSAEVYQGIAEGELVFCGFGIENEQAEWDDFAEVQVEDRIAIVLTGEPDVGEALAGDELSAEASVWNKIDELTKRGAAGVLIVQGRQGRDGAGQVPLGYRVSRATWSPPSFDKVRGGIPALEISRDLAARVLGVEMGELERTEPRELDGGDNARIEAAIERASVTLRNVVGLQRGTEPDAGYVVIGAHLDHIGVGPRGRVAPGADDNASGVAGLLALVGMFSASPPRVSVLYACFSGEEDGLLGSRALAQDLRLLEGIGEFGPVRLMVNMDMIGRGPRDGVAVLRDAPMADGRRELDALLERAAVSDLHGLTSVRRVDEPGFFERSDQMAFYEVGIPAVFVFEDWPHRPGGMYHSWRDTPDQVSVEKVERTAAFVGVMVGGI